MVPLPPEITTTTAPVSKSKSLDDLIGELAIPRQNTQPTIPAPETPSPDGTVIQNPASRPFFSTPETTEPGNAVSEETAIKFGAQVAGWIDNGSSSVCSFISLKEKKEKYRLTQNERTDLTNAWASVARKYGFSELSPELNAAATTLFVVAPNFKTAFQDRQINQLKKEMDKMKAEYEIVRQDIAEMKRQRAVQTEEEKAQP